MLIVPFILWTAALGFQAPSPLTVTSTSPPFKIVMPARSKDSTKDTKTDTGTIHQEIHVCTMDQAVYMAISITNPAPIPRGGEEKAIEAGIRGYVDTQKATLVSSRPLIVGDMKGAEAVIDGPAPGGKGRMKSKLRLFITQTHSIYLTAVAPPGKPMPAIADRFLASFKPGPANPSVDEMPAAAATTTTPAAADPAAVAAVRAFFVAMVMADEAAVRAVTLPAPSLDVLWQGPAAPASKIEGMKNEFATIEIRALGIGERYAMPNNRSFAPTAADIGPDRVVLVAKTIPFPIRVRKVGDAGKVDARPIIAARKAAAAGPSTGKTKKN